MNFPITEIQHLIPQKDPFVLVSSCISHDESDTVATFIIPANHVLVEDNRLSPYGLIEHMAQSAAIRSGLAAQMKNEPPPIGFIGTINDAIIHHLPPVGAEIHTTVHQTTALLNIIVIETQCFMSDRLIAQSKMKIVLMGDQV